MPRLTEQTGLLVLKRPVQFRFVTTSTIHVTVFPSLFIELVRVDKVNFLTIFSKLKGLKFCSRT